MNHEIIMMKSIRIPSNQQNGSAVAWMLSLFFIFIMGALVIDASMLYRDKRELQSMANALAGELAGAGQTCSVEELMVNDVSMAQERLNELYPSSNASVVSAQRVLVVSEGGEISTSPVDGVKSNGVAITLNRPVTGLLAFTVYDKIEAHSVARKEVVASLSMNSFTASLDSRQSELLNLIFSEVLGSSISLSTLQFNELGNTLVDVEELLSNLVGGTPLQEPLESDVLGNVLVDVLGTVAGLDPVSSGLQKISEALVGTDIDLTDIFSGIDQTSIPPGSKIPVLGVVNSLVMNVGSKLSSISIDLLEDTTFVGGLLSDLGVEELSLDLVIDEGPAALTSSVRHIEDENGDWSWPGLKSRDIGARIKANIDTGVPLLLTLNGNVDIELNVASGEAELVGARCAKGGGENDVDIHARGRSSLLGLAAKLDLNVRLLAGFIPIPILGVDLGNGSPSEGSWLERDFLSVDLYEPKPQEVTLGGSDDAVENALEDISNDAKISLIGLPLGSALSPLLELISDILNPIVKSIVVPVLDALGVSLGGAELTLLSASQSTHIMECSRPLCANL